MKIKIGVISDTHLQKVTKDLKEIYDEYLSDKDLILHAGDIVSPEIIEFLGRNDFHGVHGNMDPPEVREMLPVKKVIELGPYRLGLIHGGGPSQGLEQRVRSQFRDVDVIVYGHSHHAVNHIRDGVLVFNPGTATGFSFSDRHSLGILELGETIRGEIIEL
jgi:putative phosphoesterase